jgi:hypothetical protein
MSMYWLVIPLAVILAVPIWRYFWLAKRDDVVDSSDYMERIDPKD